MMTTKRNEQIAKAYESNIKFAKAAAARKDARMLELYENIEEVEMEINEINEVIMMYGNDDRLLLNKIILQEEMHSMRRQMRVLQEDINELEHLIRRTQEKTEVR